jgi:hypothetical protein
MDRWQNVLCAVLAVAIVALAVGFGLSQGLI